MDAQRLKGAVQVHLQRALGATGPGGRLLQRALSQGEFFNSLALSFRQRSHSCAQRVGTGRLLQSLGGRWRGIGVGFRT